MGTTSGAATAASGTTIGNAHANGMGSADDAAAPLLDALAQAAKFTSFAGDPQVIAAIRLGWVMKEVTGGWTLEPVPDGLAPDGCVKAQGRLLKNLIPALGLADVTPDPVIAALATGDAIAPGRDLETDIVVGLVGADVRLPRAYALGGGLRALLGGEADGASASASAPTDTPAGTGGHDPVASLIDNLDPLSSSLPSHAARSVANSMTNWAGSPDADKPRLLTAQVLLWRAILVGEKKGTDLLEPDDYLLAGRKLARRYLRTALHSPWVYVAGALAAALFAGGIVLLLTRSHAGDVAAGVSGVLAGLGVTWKGIGGVAGKLAARLEEPVWGAELDTAITAAITLSTPSGAKPPGGVGYADRRGRALAARHRSGH
jgi:hypothetical protein